ncbi:uncharacterized protein LOC120174335 isoform X2 [Hibiscus syriacus]|uniref:uncharacterized protein LOC120174335 isoform X2 n=1 Tax=Hibiscus syriacus TaxID=106335 RepID=UPI0019211FCF|nr:uncharacterized protein LOC120174335 isoform X2 [Hibiscus syriacus]
MSNTQAAFGEESGEGNAQIEIGDEQAEGNTQEEPNRGFAKEIDEDDDAEEKLTGTEDGGMMRTLCGDTEDKMISQPIDGSRLCGEVHDTFLEMSRTSIRLLSFLPGSNPGRNFPYLK